MKIATITCHDVYNYGASLQAYALQHYLESIGHNCQIIDYKPDYLSKHFKLTIGSEKFGRMGLNWAYVLAKLPNRLLALPRKRAFDAFTRTYLKLSTQRYTSNDELKTNLPDADLFIAGSDQIWNTTFNNGTDPSFYLDFVPGSKYKVSYAASFATDFLRKGSEAFVAAKLANLDEISVREASGCTLARTMGFEAVQAVDPVFLLEKKHWLGLSESSAVRVNASIPYLLVYDFQESDAIKTLAIRIASQRKLAIYSISPSKLNYANKNFINIGPSDFLKLIKNARCVLSNSFHGTAFSIIFENDFFVVNREDGLNTRMRDFLSHLCLSDRMISVESSDDILKSYIDYSDVQKIIINDTDKSRILIDNWLVKADHKRTSCNER